MAVPAVACEYPDEGSMPLRRAVSRVKYLPETEAWAAQMHKAGAHVQYALLLDHPAVRDGRCYWTVEVKANGEIWKSFLVSPDGKGIILKSETGDRPAS
jgi:hypothetical protein